MLDTTFVNEGRLTANSGAVSEFAALEVIPYIKKIGKQGGMVESPAGASVFIPPNTLKEETEISVAIAHPPGAEQTDKLVSKIFDFQPGVLIFQKPAKLTLPYENTENNLQETQFSLYFWDAFQEKWISAGGKVNRDSPTVSTVEQKVTASVNHLATYAIMESKTLPPPDKLDILDLKLTPEVFYAPEINRLTIEYNLATKNADEAEVTIKIYDFRSKLVRMLLNKEPRSRGPNAEQWDGKDEDGRHVRNGRYIVVVIAKESGDTIAGKKLLVVFK